MADVDFLNSGTQLVKTATEFEDVYNVIAKATGLHNQDIFMVCVYIGVHSGQRRENSDYNGKEFRTSYLNKVQKGVLYGVAFREGLLKQEDDFKDPKKIIAVKSLCNEYANQGAFLIKNNIFSNYDLSKKVE